MLQDRRLNQEWRKKKPTITVRTFNPSCSAHFCNEIYQLEADDTNVYIGESGKPGRIFVLDLQTLNLVHILNVVAVPHQFRPGFEWNSINFSLSDNFLVVSSRYEFYI